MLTRENVFIRSESDYDKLLRYLDPQYMDENLIQQLKKYIGLQSKLSIPTISNTSRSFFPVPVSLITPSIFYLIYAKKPNFCWTFSTG